jgi:hypothetical protein
LTNVPIAEQPVVDVFLRKPCPANRKPCGVRLLYRYLAAGRYIRYGRTSARPWDRYPSDSRAVGIGVDCEIIAGAIDSQGPAFFNMPPAGRT